MEYLQPKAATGPLVRSNSPCAIVICSSTLALYLYFTLGNWLNIQEL